MNTPLSRDEFRTYMALLQKSVDDGFTEVHRRQDVTNGRIATNEQRLNAHAERLATIEAAAPAEKPIKGKLTVAAGVGAFIAGAAKAVYGWLA